MIEIVVGHEAQSRKTIYDMKVNGYEVIKTSTTNMPHGYVKLFFQKLIVGLTDREKIAMDRIKLRKASASDVGMLFDVANIRATGSRLCLSLLKKGCVARDSDGFYSVVE